MTLWHWNCNKRPVSKGYKIEVKHAFYDSMNTHFKGKTFTEILSSYDNFLVIDYKIDNANKKIVVYIASTSQTREKIIALKCKYFDLFESNGELKKISNEIKSLTEIIEKSRREGFDY